MSGVRSGIPERRSTAGGTALELLVLWPFRFAGKLVRSRELLLNLAAKEVKVRYKQSILGVAWAVFVPVAMMLIFTFVFKKVARIDLPANSRTGKEIPYAVFAYCGLLPWTFFSQSLSGAVGVLVANRPLITKIYFPREVFPVSKILACLLDFLIASLVLVALMIGFRIPVTASLFWVPLFVVIQILVTLACALILSMANLFYRDIQYVFQVAIQLWMFATAVIYPLPKDHFSPTTWTILHLNPMTPILEAYRNAVLYGSRPDFASMIPAFAVVLAVLWIGVVSFDRAQFLFAERI